MSKESLCLHFFLLIPLFFPPFGSEGGLLHPAKVKHMPNGRTFTAQACSVPDLFVGGFERPRMASRISPYMLDRRAFIEQTVSGIVGAWALNALGTPPVWALQAAPATSTPLPQSSREFIEHIIQTAGGLDKFIGAHGDLQTSVNRHSEFKDPVARMYILLSLIGPGGFSGYQISDHGHDLESYLENQAKPVFKQQFAFFKFIRDPDSYTRSVIPLLPHQFSLSQNGEEKKLRTRFNVRSNAVRISPLGAAIILGALIRDAGISDAVSLTMRKNNPALLLKVTLVPGHDFFLRIGERGSDFDLQNVGETIHPGLAALKDNEWAQSLVSWYASFLGVISPARYKKPAQDFEAYFLDLRFFSKIASALGADLFEPGVDIFYSLPEADKQHLVQLASLRAILDISGGTLRTGYPKRLIETMESRGELTKKNLMEKVKVVQQAALKAAQELEDALAGTETLEKFFTGQTADMFVSRYGNLFVTIREARNALRVVGLDPKAALQEFDNYLKKENLRNFVKEQLLIGDLRTPHDYAYRAA